MSGSDSAWQLRIKKFDIKSWLPILAFFGVTSMGSCVAKFRGPIVGWIIGPAVEAKAMHLMPIERARTDSVITDRVGKLAVGISYIEELLEEMPGGQEAAERIREKKAGRIFRRAEEWRGPRRRD